MQRRLPSIVQVNGLYLLTVVLTLVSSILLQPIIGIVSNLWINEYVYILFPPLLLVWVNHWSIEDVYKLKSTSPRNKLISIIMGICFWFFAYYISKVTELWLDTYVGPLNNLSQQMYFSVSQSLLMLIGTVVIAPICEEIYFRGMVQSAYTARSKESALVITAIMFGAFHVFNGLSQVIPTLLLGLVMGYLVLKTDSLASSILFHGAANTSAIVFGRFLESVTESDIPGWLTVTAFGGSILAVLLCRLLVSAQNTTEQNAIESDESVSWSPAAIIILLLAALLFIGVGVLEILVRLGIIQQ